MSGGRSPSFRTNLGVVDAGLELVLAIVTKLFLKVFLILPNLYDFKLLFPFSRIIIFTVNKGLQTLLIRKELTELLHLILSVDNCALLFTL